MTYYRLDSNLPEPAMFLPNGRTFLAGTNWHIHEIFLYHRFGHTDSHHDKSEAHNCTNNRHFLNNLQNSQSVDVPILNLSKMKNYIYQRLFRSRIKYLKYPYRRILFLLYTHLQSESFWTYSSIASFCPIS